MKPSRVLLVCRSICSLILLASAIHSAAPAWSQTDPDTGAEILTLTVDGVTRTALVSPGVNAGSTPSPVVLDFHGFTESSTGAFWQSGLNTAWPEATVVYPQGLPVMLQLFNITDAGWQIAPGDVRDRDLHFVDAILDAVATRYKVDPRRIYATGFSNGAIFTYLLMSTRPERFAAFAPVSAYGDFNLNRATLPRPVMTFEGKIDDQVLPGWSEQARREALRLNGCKDQTESWSQGYLIYTPCSSEQPVVFRSHEGGHEWPEDATMNIVKFFQEHPLAQDPVNIPPSGSPSYQYAGGRDSAQFVPTTRSLYLPDSVAYGPQGQLIISEGVNGVLRSVAPEDTATALAGNGFWGYSEDGSDAKSSGLFFPDGLASDSTGQIVFADRWSHRIRRVASDGTLQTVAGIVVSAETFKGSFAGDGGPANQARLSFPTDVALDATGNLYFTDTGNERVRKVDANGIITTVAGNGTAGFSGDGGPALSAQLNDPTGIAVDRLGAVYIADRRNHRIRKITPDGIIRTVAGNGVAGSDGDGGPATGAALQLPADVAVDSEGRLFIADTFNHRIRRVELDGRIASVEISADDPLHFPQGLAIGPTGDLAVVEPYRTTVRRLKGVAAPGLIAGQPFAGSNPEVIPGDLNGDGKVNVSDATLLLRAAVGLESLTADQTKAADVNGDGKVNVADATQVLRKAVGL